MRKATVILMLLMLLALPVKAMEYTAPEAPVDALELMPAQVSNFTTDLMQVITGAIGKLRPSLGEAVQSCATLFVTAMLISILKNMPGKTVDTAHLAGVLAVSVVLLQSTRSMVTLAADTVTELSEYGKLLIPVMTAALASQGGITTSTALYAGTVFFDTVLSTAIANLLIPMVYIFLILTVAAAATGEGMLAKLRDFIQWLVTWCLKTILYVFTGYMGVTGVVSGSTDAATLKATKLTMSGVVPVVGGILSEASEAVIVSAGVMKNAVGVYGMVAVAAIWVLPFMKIGIQYLLLKLTCALCGIFDVKPVTDLIRGFSAAMSFLLAMVGAICILLLISVVCLMKGMN